MLRDYSRGVKVAFIEAKHKRGEIGLVGFLLLHIFSLEQRIITCYRIGHELEGSRAFLARLTARVLRASMHRMGSSIAFSAEIGTGIGFPHPFGIVIGEGVHIGENTRIWQQVTLGSAGRDDAELAYPTIGDRVRIYTKASVIGAVTVGSDVTIAAHALVLSSVPDDSVAVGIPARVLPKSRGA